MRKIGKLEFKDIPLCLSPMAGFSSVTFRGICHEMGADYSPTELVSARSIVYNGLGKSFRYMEIDPGSEGLTCIQLFGNDPEDFAEAVKQISNDELLSKVDIIDINMGCPVPKVVKTGAGSALLSDVKLAGKIVSATVKAASEYGKPVTVKTRIGWDDRHMNGKDLVLEACEKGAAAVCVHGRTRAAMYGGEADMEAVARIREAVPDTFFFANGDIRDGRSAQRVLEITGADGLMIGRGAVGNPWVFRNIRSFMNGNEFVMPSVEDRCDMLLRELEGTASRIGETTAVKEMRSVMPHYIKGLRGSARVKAELCRSSTISEVRGILDACRMNLI
jgi:tRNA-dihydrouridine synthase B